MASEKKNMTKIQGSCEKTKEEKQKITLTEGGVTGSVFKTSGDCAAGEDTRSSAWAGD
jgi:hypothetical protein